MINLLHTIQDSFLRGNLKEFTLEEGYYTIKVHYTTKLVYGCHYFLNFKYKDFEDTDCSATPQGMLENITRYLDFIQEVKNDPDQYRSKTLSMQWVKREQVEQTINDILGGN